MINRLFKNRFILSSIQLITLTAFVLLIYGALGVTTKDPDFAIKRLQSIRRSIS